MITNYLLSDGFFGLTDDVRCSMAVYVRRGCDRFAMPQMVDDRNCDSGCIDVVRSQRQRRYSLVGGHQGRSWIM